MEELIDVVEEEKEFGFDLERFRYDGPWPEKMPAADDCALYNAGASTVKELLTGDTQPVLAIDGEVWADVQYLVNATPNKELACFLVLKQFSSGVPKYLAVDLFFPKQETGAAGVAIDAPSVNKFYGDLNAHEDYRDHMHSRLCHLHSHASMGCFWSAADTNQQMSHDDLGFYDDFRFYVVVNTKNELRCSFVQYQPFLRRFDNIPVVVIGKGTVLSDERKAELDGWLKDRTSPLTTNVFEDLRSFPAYATEEYKPRTVAVTPKYDWQRTKSGTHYYGYGSGTTGRKYGTGKDDRWWDDFNYDDDYHYEQPKRSKSGFRYLEDVPPLKPKFENGSVANKFVAFFLYQADYSLTTVISNEDLEKMSALVEENGTEAANELLKSLSKLSLTDKHDFWTSFMDYVECEEDKLEDVVDSAVYWLDWFMTYKDELKLMSELISWL